MAEPVSFSVRVDNIGGAPSGAFSVNVYSDGNLIHTENLSELLPCGKILFNVNHTFLTVADHLITVIVDEAGAVDEFSESNNTYGKTCKNQVVIVEPNLQVGVSDLDILPVLPGEGENFEISAAFRNNGNGEITAPFDVDFVVTEEGVQRTETLRISENIAPGQVISGKIATSLATYGNHTVKVLLDSQNEIVEKSEGDNTAAGSLCVDFKPSIGGGVWNGGFYRDTQQYLTVNLQNLGLFTAENVSVKFFLDDQEIAATTVLKVGPYGKSSGSVGISLPYVFEKDGVFELSVRVDDTDSYTECNEENNNYSRSIVVKPPLPDLRVISEYIAPTELNPDLDEPINIFLSFENKGVMKSDAFIAKVVVDDVQLGQEITIPSLNPGEDGTIAIAAPYSSSTGGVKIIRGFVDPGNLVVESDETNNEASRAIIVGEAPNLLFTSLDSDINCPENGEEIIVSTIIENEGDLGTDAEIEYYYLTETDTVPIDRKEVYVGPNSISTSSINWTVVNNTYHLFARILTTSLPEYDVLDNEISTEFCTVEQYAINMNILGQGIVRKNPDRRKFDVNSQVELKAIPAEGWFFKGWSGALIGNTNPATVIVDSDKELTAIFEQIPDSEFTINLNIQGEGEITRSPEKDTYLPNEEVIVQAIPVEGFVFIGWLGDINSSETMSTLIMNSNKSISAVFVEDLKVSPTVTDATCAGASDGSIDLNMTGGNLPYSFDWDNDGTGGEDPEPDSKDLDNLIPGLYTVVVTDGNGLTKTILVEVASTSTDAVTTLYPDVDGDGYGDSYGEAITGCPPLDM